MPEPEEVLAQAAESLGISIDRMELLPGPMMMFRNADTVYLDAPILVYADKNEAELWEIEISGIMHVLGDDGGMEAEFRYRILVHGLELWKGSSQTPDRFKITIGGRVVFDGQVEHPDTLEDAVGWARYDLFEPIRLGSCDVAMAMLATHRIETRIVEE